ncbi:antitoxin Xre/MbcA/ParS toxin-binding domain-containing protein [Spiribacter halobius]|uniref:Uncharacterized protein n=1 Tax=Sediminicurvatus halobius TaxID=2182432 RepID=A0A2U2MXC0_9GAMM|nr:hypothetical protein DEM34_15895 [Spiribacter halobius]
MGVRRTHGTDLAYFLGDLDGLEDVALGEVDWRVFYQLIEKGVPVSSAARMLGRVGAAAFEKCVISRSTLRSKARSARLSAFHSERALRVARVFARATEVFGDRSRAVIWLTRANHTLDGAAPADLLRNEAGGR